MKKWMNTLFLGSCFIAALLIQIFGVQVLEGDIISSLGLGIVVLITGYLFMDSVRGDIKKSIDKSKFYIEKSLSEDAEKWNARYMELLKLQKASYTATKKNSELVATKFDDVLLKIETLENINTKSQQKIVELQKKAMEGQKKALNLEINYHKESTKQILEMIQMEKNNNMEEQLSKILGKLEENEQLIKEGLNRIEALEKNYSSIQQSQKSAELKDSANKVYNDTINDKYNEIINDNYNNTINDNYNEVRQYEDSYSNSLENMSTDDEEFENQSISSFSITDSFADGYNNTATIEETQAYSEDSFSYTDENTPETDSSYIEEPESEAVNPITPKVEPLYEDPNKALTADEIAALFASFGN